MRLRVCYFGTYRADYSRNQIMIEGLRRNGVEVIECHEPLWRGIEDRVQATSGGWRRPSFLWRLLRTYARLLIRYCRVRDYDVLVVGYPGQLDVYLARLLSWMRRKPMVWDIFMSIYLIALERGLYRQSRSTVNLLRRLECLACRMPDLLILDTADYVAWFQDTHGVPADRFRLVPTGADDRVFKPVTKGDTSDGTFRAVYYGTFIPNHGVDHIVETARLLANDSTIRFELIGRGPDKQKASALVQRYGLSNVEFVDWLDKEELVERIAAADVCLGVFGNTPQSLMTIQNKIYEGLAMSMPVITGDSPTVRQSLAHAENVYLCERANPQALADAVRALKADPGLRQRLTDNGHRLYRAQFDLQHNGARYAAHLREVATCRRASPTT
jgi:glycosyltransferase involved in cell wall biosynthesis